MDRNFSSKNKVVLDAAHDDNGLDTSDISSDPEGLVVRRNLHV